MKKKIIYGFLILSTILLIVVGINYRLNKVVTTATEDEVKEREVYLNIITTNKMLYSAVRSITGDRHNVEYMFNSQEEQWNYQFTQDSVNNISKKDLFIYSGANYEPWANEFIEALKKDRVGIINASRGTKILYFTKARTYKEREIKENPYYWLSPEEFKASLLNIKNAIQERDPKNRDFYEQNFFKVIKELDGYSEKYKEAIKNLDKYTFIYGEEDLEYLVKYSQFKSIKLNIKSEDKSEEEKIIKKIEENKNLIMLYNNEENLAPYKEIISKYQIPLVKFEKEDNKGNLEVFRKNIEALNNFITKLQ